jgi:hypothetical protein
MAQKKIYSNTKSHWDNDKDWNPAESGQGTDTHDFTVPDGQKYVRYSVDVQTNTILSGYSIESAPKAGSTGRQKIKVKWWYNPFGKIRYTLEVFAGDAEIIKITFLENNWIGKAQDAIQQGQNFQIILRGPQAKELFGEITRLSGHPMGINFFIEPVSDSVAITLIIVLGLMSIAAFATIAAILIYAIHEDYNAKASHNVHGPLPFDDELIIEVNKN